MTNKFLNDAVLNAILSYLSLRQKIRLISVSQQFRALLDRQLASVTKIHAIITFQKIQHYRKNGEQMKRFDLCFRGSYSSAAADIVFPIEQIKRSYGPLIARLKGLKVIEIWVQCVSEQLFEWIVSSFPKIKLLIVLHPNPKKKWNIEWFRTVQRQLSANMTSLWISKFSENEIEDICDTDLIYCPQLKKLVFQECLTINKRTEIFLHLPTNITFLDISEKSNSGLSFQKLKIIVDRVGFSLRVLVITVDRYSQLCFDLVCGYCHSLTMLQIFCDCLKTLEPLEMLSALRFFRLELKNRSVIFLENSRHKALKKLIICGELSLKPESMNRFAINYPKLQHLSITDFTIACKKSCQLNCVQCYQQFLSVVSDQFWVSDHNKKRLKNSLHLTFRVDNAIERHERLILLALMRDFMASQHFYVVKVAYKQISDFVDLLVDLIVMSYMFPELSSSSQQYYTIYFALYDHTLYREVYSYKNLFPENLCLVRRRPQKRVGEKRVILGVKDDSIYMIGSKNTSISFNLNI